MTRREKEMNFKVGQYVAVKHDLSKTDRAFSATRRMRELKGKRIKITDTRWTDRHGESIYLIRAEGFSWDSDDLRPFEDKLVTDMGETGVFKFDASKL